MSSGNFDEICTLDATSTDAQQAAAVLTTYGVVKFRRCFDRDLIQNVVAEAKHIYNERELMARAGTLPAASQSLFTRRTIPLGEVKVSGLLAPTALASPIFVNLARHYLGKQEPTQNPSSFIRALVPGPNDQRLPFHQDQTILAAPLLNVWIPLTPCGRDAPGLEVAVAGERKQLAVAGSPDHPVVVERSRIDEALVEKTYGTDALWAPEFETGDALVFTGVTVHRTHIRPEMTKSRLSVELRFT